MIKTETKAKQNITKQLKLDLKFFKTEVQTMEQLKTSLSSWYYEEKMTNTIIKNVNSDKYNLKQAKEVISKRLNKFYNELSSVELTSILGENYIVDYYSGNTRLKTIIEDIENKLDFFVIS